MPSKKSKTKNNNEKGLPKETNIVSNQDRNGGDDDHDGAEVEARKLRKSRIEANDAEHFKIFGLHLPGYLAFIEQEDKGRLEGGPSRDSGHTGSPAMAEEEHERNDLPNHHERKRLKSRLEQYREGFEEAVTKKFGRLERLPSESPVPHLLALGEGFINSMEISGPGVEKALTVYDERIKEIVLKKTQFADQESSFHFFSHLLSLPSEAQVSYFTTGITLDAIASNMKFQSFTSSAFLLKSFSSKEAVCFDQSHSSNESSSSSSTSFPLSKALGSSSVTDSVARQFEKSPEKIEIGSKAADFVFNNPVLYFVKNTSVPSVLHAICLTREFLPGLSFSQKMNRFSLYDDDAGKQVHAQLKNRFDVLKRLVIACMYGCERIDVRPIPDKHGLPVYVQKEAELAQRLLEVQDDLKDSQSKRLGRLEDVKYVVTKACELACYVLDNRAANPRIAVDAEYVKKFYESTHEQRVRRLELRGATVYTIAFMIHVMFCTSHSYDAKDDTIFMSNTITFNTAVAIKEIVLWLLCAGQDNNKNNYKLKSETESGVWLHVPGEFGNPLIAVPGIGTSQLDSRNQDALVYVKELLNAEDIEEYPFHTTGLLSKGAHGCRPPRFFSGPVYMNGWPSCEVAPSVQASNKADKQLSEAIDAKKTLL